MMMGQRGMRRWGSAIAIVLFLMVQTSWCLALETVAVRADSGRIALGPRLQVLKDPERRFDLEQVLARSAAFSPSDQEILNPGYTDAGYWVRFRLKNPTSQALTVYLKYQSRFVDHLDLHQVADDGRRTVVRSGRTVPPPERPYQSREFVFPIELSSGTASTFYVYAASADTLTLPFYLMDAETLKADRLTTHSWFVFYQGLVFAMSVFSLFMFLIVRSSVYLYYSLAIVLHHGLFFALFDGFGSLYFGLEDPWWSREAISILLCISMAVILQFGRALLNTAEELPRLDRLVRGLIVFALITAVFSTFIDYYISIRIGNPIASATAVLMWVVGWMSYRNGHAAARYFLMAWTFVIIGGIAYSLKSWGLAPSNLFTEYGWQIGSGIEALLLSMAIAERVRVEVQHRERSQEQAREAQEHALAVQRRSNEVLEERVRQRTEELEAANRKLEQVSITDDLTGLPNKRYLQQTLVTEVERARREQTPVAVMMLDIDHFKQINDAYGHLVGDDCLYELARLLQGEIQRSTDLVARYGGEEFCVVLPNTDASGAIEVGECVRSAVEALRFTVNGESVPITVSAGLTVERPSDSVSSEHLVQLADDALYQAKRDGRNRLVHAV